MPSVTGNGPASLRGQMPEILEDVDEKLSRAHASSVGLLVAGVGRPVVADREPEHQLEQIARRIQLLICSIPTTRRGEEEKLWFSICPSISQEARG